MSGRGGDGKKRPGGESASPRARKKLDPEKDPEKDPYDLDDEDIVGWSPSPHAQAASRAVEARAALRRELARLQQDNDRLHYGIDDFIDDSIRRQERRDEDDNELEVAVSCLLAMLCVKKDEFTEYYRAFGKQLGCSLKPVIPWARSGAPDATYDPSYAFADIIVALRQDSVRPLSSASNPVDQTEDESLQAFEGGMAAMEEDESPQAFEGGMAAMEEEPKTLEEMEEEVERLRAKNAELEEEFHEALFDVRSSIKSEVQRYLSEMVSTLFLQYVPPGYAVEDSFPNPLDMCIHTVEFIAVADYLKDLLKEFCPVYTALGKKLGVEAVKVCPSEGHFLDTCTPVSYPLKAVLAKLAGMSAATGRAAIPSFPALKM